MKVAGEFDYRNAKALLDGTHSGLVTEVLEILKSPTTTIDLTAASGQRDLSAQLAQHFVPYGWERERPVFSVADLRYDLLKSTVPVEIELGHQRLVYADFFKFLADYSQSRIPVGLMIVTGHPEEYGHSWHNSLASTRRKLEAIQSVFLVPILIIAVDP